MNRGMQIGAGSRIGKSDVDAGGTVEELDRTGRGRRHARPVDERTISVVGAMYLATVQQARHDLHGDDQEKARAWLQGPAARCVEWYLGLPCGTGARALQEPGPRGRGGEE
jgi:hypothetical protein